MEALNHQIVTDLVPNYLKALLISPLDMIDIFRHKMVKQIEFVKVVDEFNLLFERVLLET